MQLPGKITYGETGLMEKVHNKTKTKCVKI